MMTEQTEEALKMAMGVLLSINQGKQHLIVIDDDRGFFQREEWVRWAIDEVVPQIKDALEQPSVAELNDEYLRDTHVEGLQPAQEPVAWCDSLVSPKAFATNIQQRCPIPLYTHPAPSWQGNKEFVGLSDDEIDEMSNSHLEYDMDLSRMDDFARAIEAKIKEKNT